MDARKQEWKFGNRAIAARPKKSCEANSLSVMDGGGSKGLVAGAGDVGPGRPGGLAMDMQRVPRSLDVKDTRKRGRQTKEHSAS